MQTVYYPKITIVTACLNVARSIETTIKSVLEQHYTNLEYILIDGASTDGTLDIVNKYKDKITKIVSEPDKGIYDAFNKGIALATGDLIGILSADDFYAPWTLSTMGAAYIARSRHAVYYGKLFFIYEDAGWWSIPSMQRAETLPAFMSIPHPTCFVPLEIYKEYGAFDTSFSMAGDWDFFLRLYQAGEKFFAIDKVLTAMRSGGLSSQIDLGFAESIKIWERHLSEADLGKAVSQMSKSMSDSKRRLHSRVYDAALWWLGKPRWDIESEAWGQIPSDWTFENPFDFPWHLL